MRPVVLVIDDDAADRCFAGQLFTSFGWHAVGATTDDWPAIGREATPALVLSVASGSGPAPTIAALRAHPAIRDAPVAAWVAAPSPGDAVLADYDDVLDKAAEPAAMTALARRWRPDDPSAVLDRLEAVLGRDEIGAMTGRLRDQLATAMAALATDDHQAEAHRLAGIAGMLGFDELGAAWLAVSLGTAGSGAAARIASRRALSALGRRCAGVSWSAARP